jgi:hypothetical protein
MERDQLLLQPGFQLGPNLAEQFELVLEFLARNTFGSSLLDSHSPQIRFRE